MLFIKLLEGLDLLKCNLFGDEKKLINIMKNVLI